MGRGVEDWGGQRERFRASRLGRKGPEGEGQTWGGGSRNDRRLGSEWNLSLYDFRGAAVLGDNKAPGVAVRTDG